MKLPMVLRNLRVGESAIVESSNATALSAAFGREKPLEFTQRQVLIIDPQSLEARRAWIVTRTT